jgi:hypothetical protein
MYRQILIKASASMLLAILALAQVILLPVTTPAQSPDGLSFLFDNGPLATGTTTQNGVAAPAGSQWSEVQNDFGVTTQANTSAGSTVTGAFRLADDFNVPVGETWTINSVIVHGYQTGFTGTTSPFTGGTLRIWNGRPGDPGSTIVFGDTTTNRLTASTDSGIFRVFNTVVGAGANPPTAPGTTRRIWQNTLAVSPALVLTAGNYWIDFALSGPATAFAPTVTIPGTRTVPGFNARQFNATWVEANDTGQAPTGQPTPYIARQDFPFKLTGSATGVAPVPRSRTNDYDGDNRTDFAVARSASPLTQSTWFIAFNSGGTAGYQWGLGVGVGGDIATPADYDGDGRTDIAVWRPSNRTFYVLKSNGSVLDVDQFGNAGDDPTIVGDYDGDGKADLAVYRPGASAGAASSFWYQRSTVGGTGCGSAGSCNAVTFGVNGDRPYPGDFDGDRRYDFSLVRNVGGAAEHHQLRTTQGYIVANYGLFTDRFVTMDRDADGRNDLVAVRDNGGVNDWYMTLSGSGELFYFKYGATGDLIVPGDYDADKRSDFVVFRSGRFFQWKTFTPPVSQFWGQAGDYPVGTAVNVH